MSEPQIIRNGESYDLDTREHMDNGVSVQMCPNDMGAHSNVSQNLSDTREKLEADVRQAAEKMEEFTHGEKFINTNKILRWLDRQAAITERELCGRCSPYATAKDYMDTIERLTAERDELREQLNTTRDVAREFRDERDELREALDACGTGTMYELWRRDRARLEAIRAALHDKPGT